MKNEKIKLSVPVAVEGKYDKIKLSNIIDANIIATDGFGVFKNAERLSLIRRLSENGIIVLTDSDGAGKVIRGHISSAVKSDKIYNLYIPQIKGKEKRKDAPSKEGTLGVEGIDDETLYSLFEKLCREHPNLCGGSLVEREPITKADMYELGLTGAPDSAEKRNKLCQMLGLPLGMTPTALQKAMEMLMTREDFLKLDL